MHTTYDLHKLGWYNFQQLCLTICREVLGQTVVSFLESNDGGRDGAFVGTWSPNGAAAATGEFVIQCKFTSRENQKLRRSALSDEISKAKRLVDLGRCDVYVLMTNLGISGRVEESIVSAFKSIGAKHVLLLGFSWICEQIQESRRLRALVPRVYGLGDLSQILDERAYSQARALLASMREDLAKVVITDSYRRARDALQNHGFVMLVGEPAAGKTTIASLLAIASMDEWGVSTLKLDSAQNVLEHWNPESPLQFMWVDDAFGVTQYEPRLVFEWNRVLLNLRAMVKQGTKIVMTSRDYIYSRARRELKGSAFPLLQESQVVVDVHNLSLEEKRQILYNHLRMGRQPTGMKRALKPHLEAFCENPRFIPEAARRIADPAFTKGLMISAWSLRQFVENLESFLKELIRGLDADSRAALALIYMRNGRVESPVVAGAGEDDTLQRMDSTLGRCLTALESLRGSLVRLTNTGESLYWEFAHPTVGDAFASVLVESPELLGIFIQGSVTAKLLTQITCGDVGYERAIVVPPSYFPEIVRRLNASLAIAAKEQGSTNAWMTRHSVLAFLARRCSREFLVRYLAEQPTLAGVVSKPGLYLNASSDLQLALRLHSLGLLSEEERRALVATVTSYAVDGHDAHALEDQELRAVFTEEEFAVLRERILDELVPRLSEVWSDVRRDGLRSDDPDEHVQPYVDLLDALEREFAEPQVRSAVSFRRDAITDWLAERRSATGSADRATFSPSLGASSPAARARSIFDDVDE